MKHTAFSLSLIFCSVIFLHHSLFAQWDQYEAVWQGSPGRMMVNLDFEETTVIEPLVFLLEIEQRALTCTSEGYPKADELPRFEATINAVLSLIQSEYSSTSVGRFFYQCMVKDYIYVSDTVNLRQELESLKDVSFSIKLREDRDHKVYSSFIYPDDFLMQTMVNGKIIRVLRAEAYDLDKKSTLTHFASFASDEERKKYRRFVQEQNFEVLDLDRIEDSPLPYRITFSRKDQLDLEKLSNITLRLHQKAEFLVGSYDGWEIELVEK